MKGIGEKQLQLLKFVNEEPGLNSGEIFDQWEGSTSSSALMGMLTKLKKEELIWRQEDNAWYPTTAGQKLVEENKMPEQPAENKQPTHKKPNKYQDTGLSEYATKFEREAEMLLNVAGLLRSGNICMDDLASAVNAVGYEVELNIKPAA